MSAFDGGFNWSAQHLLSEAETHAWSGRCARSPVAWRTMQSYDGVWRGLQRAIVYRLCVPEPAGMLVGACGTAEPVVSAGAMAV